MKFFMAIYALVKCLVKICIQNTPNPSTQLCTLVTDMITHRPRVQKLRTIKVHKLKKNSIGWIGKGIKLVTCKLCTKVELHSSSKVCLEKWRTRISLSEATGVNHFFI